MSPDVMLAPRLAIVGHLTSCFDIWRPDYLLMMHFCQEELSLSLQIVQSHCLHCLSNYKALFAKVFSYPERNWL